ncbi:MAG: DMT family transporter [Thermoanaerobaculia bacterium]
MNVPDGPGRGAVFGLAAAFLFGVSAPIAKLLLVDVGFLMLASLLYLGAGLGLSALTLMRRQTREAALQRGDLLPLAGIVITGGIVGPALLLYGLQTVSGLVGSLLLNLEAPFTMLLAVFVFREHMTRGEVMASAMIVTGSVVLGYERGASQATVLGALAVAGACLSWGIDNNLTQKVTLRDPVSIVRIKTLAAGACMLIVALAAGQRLPAPRHIAAALVLGLFSYGISILLDTYALRLLGAAREAALFATAPFIGALLSIPMLGDRVTLSRASGFLLMSAGVVVLLRARHAHQHTHEAVTHEHLHTHDDHHRHAHAPGDPPGEPHAHEHRHDPLKHEHPHVSDIHHRHEH